MVLGVFLSTQSVAQTPEIEEKSAQESEQTSEQSEAAQAYQNALKAFDSDDYEKALFELDKAWRLDRKASYMHQRILVLEAMKKQEMALELLRTHREVLLEDSKITDLYLVEERLLRATREATDSKNASTTEPDPEPDASESVGRSALNWAGPITLGVVGTGLTIWGATFFSESCELEGSSGCLQLEEAQTGTGIALTSAGIAAIAGAIVWFVLTSPENPSSASKPGWSVRPDGMAIHF